MFLFGCNRLPVSVAVSPRRAGSNIDRTARRTGLLGGFLITELFAVCLSIRPALAADPCFADFSGKTAKELSDCINSMRESIAELKAQTLNTAILAAGVFDDKGTDSITPINQIGLFTAKAYFDQTTPTTAHYIVKLNGPFPLNKPPIVLTGPITKDTQAIAGGSEESSKFTVTTLQSGQVFHTGFWFLILSAERNESKP
jgi:hypothetical protein